MSYNLFSSSYRAFVSSLSSIKLLQDWKTVIAEPEWKEAMIKEMRVLGKTGSWELVPSLPGKELVGCKWFFFQLNKKLMDPLKDISKVGSQGFHSNIWY